MSLLDELYEERAVHVPGFVSRFGRKRQGRNPGHCGKGHPLADAYRKKNGALDCRPCSLARARMYSLGKRSHA